MESKNSHSNPPSFGQISNKNDGFTLIELMVVLSIFAVLLGAMFVNLAGLRGARNLKIAQSELVSNIRKIQSYTLSSRAINGTIPAQFYLLKLDAAVPDRYTIQALYDVTSTPKLYTNIETIMLPQGIKIASTTSSFPFIIDRPPIGGTADSYDSPPAPANCVLIAYKLPYGNNIFANGCSPSNPSTNPYVLTDSDDYVRLKNFAANSPTNSVSNNSILTVTLSTTDNKLSRTVIINGINGTVTFSQ